VGQEYPLGRHLDFGRHSCRVVISARGMRQRILGDLGKSQLLVLHETASILDER
jgi:hypothetical protein